MCIVWGRMGKNPFVSLLLLTRIRINRFSRMRKFSNFKGDLAGAVSAAIVTLPQCIGFGLVAFAAMGPEFTSKAAAVGIYTAFFTGCLAALLGGSPVQITGPKAPLSLVLASLFASFAGSHKLPVSPEVCFAVVLGFYSLAVLLGGAFQVVLGALKLGVIVKYVPRPIISGFMNGVAIMLIYGQIKATLGVDGQTGMLDVLAAPSAIVLSTLAVVFMTLVAVRLSGKFIRSVPSTLTGLVVGTLTHYLIGSFLPPSMLGLLVGKISIAFPAPTILLVPFRELPMETIREFLTHIVVSGVILGLIGSTESLLSAMAFDNLTGDRHDSNRELIGQGIGNIASSFFGSIAAAGSVSRSLASFSAGGRTPLSGVLCSVIQLLVILILGSAVERVPLAAVGGIILYIGILHFDPWTLRLIGKLKAVLKDQKKIPHGEIKDVLIDFVVMSTVALVTLFFGIIVAVSVGVAISSALFISKVGKSIVKRRYRADRFHSKKMRNEAKRALLEREGSQIVVVELQGPVFFGATESLTREIDDSTEGATYLILDLKRVTEIDSSGANAIFQIERRLKKQEKHLLISYMGKGHSSWRFLEFMDVVDAIGQDCFFSDTDTALEWAEERLLRDFCSLENACAEFPLEHMEVFKKFTPDELNVFKSRLVRESYRQGEAIFREGDANQDLYLLVRGSVSVKIRLPYSERLTRLLTFTSGVVFGEMALLDGRPRSADVWAEEYSEVLRLPFETFKALQGEAPEIIIKMMMNIARILSKNLRRTSNEVRELEDS